MKKYKYLAVPVAVLAFIALPNASFAEAVQMAAANVQSTSASAAPQTASTPSLNAYRLGPGDVIRVIVYNEADLSVEQATVGPAGDIAAPLIGPVTARNLTTDELGAELSRRYSAGYLRNPRVSVSVVTFRPFYVVGEVANPGAFPYAADLTPASAIAFAGGFSRGASRSRIYIRRAGETTEQSYSIHDAVAVHPGDTVRVGESALSIIRQLPLGLIP